MERPSHIIFDTRSHYFSRRLPVVGLAISLQVAALWLFMHAFTDYRIPPIIRDFTVDPIPELQSKERVKPPEPKLTKPKLVIAEEPVFHAERNGGDTNGIHTSVAQEPVTDAARPTIPDRGAVSIAATHTVPPYPPIARRIGAEGKVTLRLTVTAEGRVNEAEVVTSSGRDDLDQTARAWIVAHWAYKPALANGVPVASKTLATVTFSLINER